jgi:hypothetical protein
MPPTTTATTTATATAATALVVVGLVACGDPARVFLDAGPIDATIADGSPGLDAPLARVTVHVRSLTGDGAPAPEATVFFVDPDGRIASQTSPDAEGLATGAVIAPGSVTVGWPGESIYLATVYEVEDGDSLTFGSDALGFDRAVTVTVPVRAGASSYSVAGPCMTGGTVAPTIAAHFSLPCGASHPLIVQANAVGMQPVYLTAASVTPTEGGTIALVGAWAAGTTATVELTGIPAGATDLRLTRRVLVGGHPSTIALATNPTIVDGGATLGLRAPVDFGDGAQLSIAYRDTDDRFYAVDLFRPSLAEPAPLDVAPTVPRIASTTQTGHTVMWTLAGAGTFDAAVLDLEDVGDFEQTIAAWRVIAPPTASQVTLPLLPAPYDRATIPLRAVKLVDASTVPDYRALRPLAGAGTWVDAPPLPTPTGTWIVRH